MIKLTSEPKLVNQKPMIAIDFDKTIHKYSQGWKDGTIYDGPIKNTRTALKKLSSKYRIVIFTTRGDFGVPPELGNEKDTNTIWGWLKKYNFDDYIYDVTNIKPPEAKVFIDDRALNFNGNWDEVMKKVPSFINKSILVFGKAINFGNQLDMFSEGAVKDFGDGDKRKLEMTSSGKLRWKDADTKEKTQSKPKIFINKKTDEIYTEKRYPDLSKQERALLEKAHKKRSPISHAEIESLKIIFRKLDAIKDLERQKMRGGGTEREYIDKYFNDGYNQVIKYKKGSAYEYRLENSKGEGIPIGKNARKYLSDVKNISTKDYEQKVKKNPFLFKKKDENLNKQNDKFIDINTLKELAEKFVDGKISGNQDQIVTNFIGKRYSNLSEDAMDEKIFSATKNFDEYKRKILKERQKNNDKSLPEGKDSVKASQTEPVNQSETKGKEPYEMTKDEYANNVYHHTDLFNSYPKILTDYVKIVAEYKGNEFTLVKPNASKGKKYAQAFHKDIVKNALAEGKKVPEEVLKDYPDLQQTTKKENTNLSYDEWLKTIAVSHGLDGNTKIFSRLDGELLFSGNTKYYKTRYADTEEEKTKFFKKLYTEEYLKENKDDSNLSDAELRNEIDKLSREAFDTSKSPSERGPLEKRFNKLKDEFVKRNKSDYEERGKEIPNAKEVAETIKNQIGGKALYMLGAKNIAFDSDGSLSFRIQGSPKGINYIKVRYNEGKDLYSITFGKISGTNYKKVNTIEDIYSDQLNELIEKNTELYTNLGTMGREKNTTKSITFFGKTIDFIKSQKNLFGGNTQQMNMFGGNREGETKSGKGGTLVLKRDKSNKGSHWHLQNKKESNNNGSKNFEDQNQMQQQVVSKPITPSKAYSILADKLGHKAIVKDHQGNILDEGKLLYLDENQEGGIKLLVKNSEGENDFVHVPQDQHITNNGSDIEFNFKDKKISVSLKELAPVDTNNIEEEVNFEDEESKARKMEEWENLASQYIRDANSQKDDYLQDLDEISMENGLKPISNKYRQFAVKSKESILNKFERNEADGNGNLNRQLTDVLRGTIVINSPNQFDDIMQSLNNKGYELWNDDLTNLYENKMPGYKHISIKLTKGDNDRIVKEVLLLTPRMYEAKYGFGHDVYDVQKNIKIGLSKMKEGSPAYKRTMRFADTMTKLTNNFYKKAYIDDMESASSLSASTSAVAPSTQESINARKDSSSKYSKPPKALIRELRSSLKAFWQPLLASSLSLGTGIPNVADSSSNILSSMASIANPTVNILNKFASNVINLRKSNNIKLFGKPLIK